MPRNLALTIIFMMCIIGPSLVIAATGFSSIGALGRNPSAAPKILTAMTITLIFAEAVAIVAFLIVWQLFSAK
jgi:F0F1-type ATP synthase membrane subunit c/vacuolar-type H+-ATPase subunit K